MKPKEVVAGGYYVREERNITMHFYSAGTDGLARYHAYNLRDGKYEHTSSCDFGTLIQWADRIATVEEISRLHRDQPDLSTYPQPWGIFEKHLRPLRQALGATKSERY